MQAAISPVEAQLLAYAAEKRDALQQQAQVAWDRAVTLCAQAHGVPDHTTVHIVAAGDGFVLEWPDPETP